jgi:predicted lipoprotein with Yx(FWY)xxD motif
MDRKRQQQIVQPRRRTPLTAVAVACAGATALAVVASFAAVALGSGGSVTVGSVSSSKLGERVAVNAQGRTLYALSAETTHHLLCKSSECTKAWPPLTVPSRRTRLKALAGVQGHLGILRRSDGLLQVTLRGLPLYRFSHDHANGEVNGQGIESFGGTWHAVPAATGSSSAAPTTPPATPAPTPEPPPYTPPPYTPPSYTVGP